MRQESESVRQVVILSSKDGEAEFLERWGTTPSQGTPFMSNARTWSDHKEAREMASKMRDPAWWLKPAREAMAADLTIRTTFSVEVVK